MRTTTDGTILAVNETFCSWVGRERTDLLSGMKLQDLLPVGARIFLQTHWTPLLQLQGSVSEVKLDVRRTDGSTIPMVLNAVRLEHEGQLVHEIAGFVARDRDKYERELIGSRKRLQELAAEAKDRALLAEQMIGIVSHDLRSPLSVIAMGSALLTRATLASRDQQIVHRMRRSADRAVALLADLLDFTRVRLGSGLGMSTAPIDLHAIVSDGVEELVMVHGAARLRHERRGEGPCVADGARLVQVLGNLVANAVAYGAPGSVITVTSSVEGGMASLAVHNDGTPIPVEAQEKIFDSMTRGSAEGASGSVGLGLFIVREIARAHQGTATVESTAAEGTTFVVQLPSLAGA